MAYIYVDSCDRLAIGILSDNFDWIEFKDIGAKKSSGVIHPLIERMLTINNIELVSIKGFIYAAGPGSYTGMRVSEGIAQIFSWQGIPVYSFYHFEVPRMMGVSFGCWIANAFKGEIFCCSWNGDDQNIELVKEVPVGDNIYSNSLDKFSDIKLSTQLIEANPRDLLANVVSTSMRKKPYYYRALDQDFKQSS